MLAEVLHFYALGWDALLEMEVTWFCKLYARIPVVEARRTLAALPALTFPHLGSDQDRRHVQAQLMRQAGYDLMRAVGATSDTAHSGWGRLQAYAAPAKEDA